MKKVQLLSSLLILTLCLSLSAAAVDPLALHLEGYTVSDNAIELMGSTNLGSLPALNEISLTVGNTALPVTNVQKFGELGEGVSAVFIADVSGSISDKKLQGIKDTLNAFTDGMTDADNACVITVGNDAYAQPFESDKSKLSDQIAAIKGMSEDTNLYSSIVKSLDTLLTDPSVKMKKCVVILSDGEDFGVKGITKDEVTAKIEKSRIPIYTIAMLDAKPAKRYIDSAKLLGSFARLSPGGTDYTHALTADSSAQIASDIRSSLSDSFVLTADLTGFQPNGNENFLQATLNVSGRGKATDGYSVPSGGLAPTVPEPEKSSPLPLYIGIAAGVLILAAVLLVVIRKRKRKEMPTEDSAEEKAGEPIPFTVSIAPEREASQPAALPGIKLKLTKVGLTEEQVFFSEIRGELIIGRDPAKAKLTFPEDKLLSGRHCAVKDVDGELILEDLSSTNGTYVNGVPIKAPYRLVNDDVLLLGSMELRVNW